MFTGIITDIGEVFKIKTKEGDKKFFISTKLKYLPNPFWTDSLPA